MDCALIMLLSTHLDLISKRLELGSEQRVDNDAHPANYRVILFVCCTSESLNWQLQNTRRKALSGLTRTLPQDRAEREHFVHKSDS